jgi:hypothetical protein
MICSTVLTVFAAIAACCRSNAPLPVNRGFFFFFFTPYSIIIDDNQVEAPINGNTFIFFAINISITSISGWFLKVIVLSNSIGIDHQPNNVGATRNEHTSRFVSRCAF